MDSPLFPRQGGLELGSGSLADRAQGEGLGPQRCQHGLRVVQPVQRGQGAGEVQRRQLVAVPAEVALEASASVFSRAHRQAKVALLQGQPAGQQRDLSVEADHHRDALRGSGPHRGHRGDQGAQRRPRAHRVARQRRGPPRPEQVHDVTRRLRRRHALVPPQRRFGPAGGHQLLLVGVQPLGRLAVLTGGDEVLQLTGQVALTAVPRRGAQVDLGSGRAGQGQPAQQLGEQRMPHVTQPAVVAGRLSRAHRPRLTRQRQQRHPCLRPGQHRVDQVRVQHVEERGGHQHLPGGVVARVQPRAEEHLATAGAKPRCDVVIRVPRPTARRDEQCADPACAEVDHRGGLTSVSPGGVLLEQVQSFGGIQLQVALVELDEPTGQPHLSEDASQLGVGGHHDPALRWARRHRLGQLSRELGGATRVEPLEHQPPPAVVGQRAQQPFHPGPGRVRGPDGSRPVKGLGQHGAAAVARRGREHAHPTGRGTQHGLDLGRTVHRLRRGRTTVGLPLRHAVTLRASDRPVRGTEMSPTPGDRRRQTPPQDTRPLASRRTLSRREREEAR